MSDLQELILVALLKAIAHKKTKVVRHLSKALLAMKDSKAPFVRFLPVNHRRPGV